MLGSMIEIIRQSMRHYLSSLLTLCTLCLSGTLLAAGTRPNIIIFIMDDVGQHDIGVFGNPYVHTPNIDQLAAEGMRFDNAFLTISSCTASRASMLTGRYPHNSGAPKLGDALPADVESLPRLLRQAGYYTASAGKWHLGEPFKSHFDKVLESREDTGAADWLPLLEGRPADKPFFFWLASNDAHAPYALSPPYHWHAANGNVRLSPEQSDNAYEREQVSLYYREIERADDSIGNMLNMLRHDKLLDNTLVIVVSDNGAIFGGAKTTLYDEGIKTPLVMRLPSHIPAGNINTQLVSSIDLAPTILSLADVDVPVSMQGISMWPTIRDPSRTTREAIYAEANQHGAMNPLHVRAVRTRNFLYLRNYHDSRFCDRFADIILGSKPRGEVYESFFDMTMASDESHNLWRDPEYRSDLNHHRQLMDAWIRDTNDSNDGRRVIFEQCLPHPLHEQIRVDFEFFSSKD